MLKYLGPMSNCSNCNAPLKYGFKWCSNCGQTFFSKNISQTNQNYVEKSWGATFFYTFAGLPLLAVGLTIFYLIFQYFPNCGSIVITDYWIWKDGVPLEELKPDQELSLNGIFCSFFAEKSVAELAWSKLALIIMSEFEAGLLAGFLTGSGFLLIRKIWK
jgi:hypothetical protein